MPRKSRSERRQKGWQACTLQDARLTRRRQSSGRKESAQALKACVVLFGSFAASSRLWSLSWRGSWWASGRVQGWLERRLGLNGSGASLPWEHLEVQFGFLHQSMATRGGWSLVEWPGLDDGLPGSARVCSVCGVEIHSLFFPPVCRSFKPLCESGEGVAGAPQRLSRRTLNFQGGAGLGLGLGGPGRGIAIRPRKNHRPQTAS
jgi:hypothetical protein